MFFEYDLALNHPKEAETLAIIKQLDVPDSPEVLEILGTPVDANNSSGVEANVDRKAFELRYTNLFILCNNCYPDATPYSNKNPICVM